MIPFIRRNIIAPLWTLKSKSPKFPYFKKLQASQYLPKEVIEANQWDKFKDILSYSYQNNQFYRKLFEQHGIKPDDIESISDMKKLPIITKSQIKENYDSIISNPYRNTSLLSSKTGGSTGTSLKLKKTENCTELKNACALRSDHWTGWRSGEPIAAVWGNPDYPESIKEKLKNFLFTPYFFLDTMNICDSSVLEFAKNWKRIQPTLLFGHAHSIFVLSQFLEKLKISLIPPKGIITTSMMLLDNERLFIEKIFKSKIFDRYGCEEVSLIASECEKHEGYHLNIEHLIIEFVKKDGTDAKPGESGDIIVTDLLNKVMPMIRYKVEDVGMPSLKKCSCGRGLPLMEKITGRVADFIRKEDGGMVAGISLIERVLTNNKGIQQLQIIQNKMNELTLNIVKEKAEYSVETEQILIQELRSILGPNINCLPVYMERIKQEESGKYRFCISNVI